MKQLTKMIGSLTAKFAALLLTLGLVGSAWGGTVTVGGTAYDTFADAITAAQAIGGAVTYTINGEVELQDYTNIAPDPITSVTIVGATGQSSDTLKITGTYRVRIVTGGAGDGNDKPLTVKNISMVDAVTGEVDAWEGTYFAPTASLSTFENVTFNEGVIFWSKCKGILKNCTFNPVNNTGTKLTDHYMVWVEGDNEVTIDGCTFSELCSRAVKCEYRYYPESAPQSEKLANVPKVTIKNTTFNMPANSKKPAIVLTHADSITLEGNTYPPTGVFELGSGSNGTTVTADITDIACKNSTNPDFGVLVDGKIYTTVTAANDAGAIKPGSTVTLFYSPDATSETVVLPPETTIVDNGYARTAITVDTYVAQIGETKHKTLAEALTTAATADVAPTVEVLVDEIDCTGWTSVTINSTSKLVTLNGNGVVLKNLSAPLFTKMGSGCKGVVVKNVTVKDANISTSSYAAAFLPNADSTETAYFENCHIVDSEITSTGSYAGGFVAYAAGYNDQNDGPVFCTVTIKDCSVKNSSITGGNSTGSLMGHATGSAWTLVNVDDTEVSGNTIICTGDSKVKAGALFGTVGAAGQESYGQTGGIVVGGDTVVKGNTMTSNGVASEQIFGRIGSSGGALTVTGGTYDGTATYANDTYDSANGKIVISGGSFKTAPSADAVVEGFVVTGTPNAEGYYTLEEYFAAQIGETKYKTLAEAIAAVGAGDVTIELLNDAEFSYPARSAYGTDETTKLTIKGNGHTLNLIGTDTDWSSLGLKNPEAVLAFENMTINKTEKGNGAWNNHALNITSKLEMKNVTVNNSLAVRNDAKLENVDIVEAGGYYGLIITAQGQDVEVKGGSITATNGGRGIKVMDEYVAEAEIEKVAIDIDGTKFTTASKAAVLVTSPKGATITTSNIDISGVAADSTHVAWVDEDRSTTFGETTLNGGQAYPEGGPTAYAATLSSDGKIEGYYKTLDKVVAAYKKGDTVKLIADVAYELTSTSKIGVTIDKSITLDGNGHKITLTGGYAAGTYGINVDSTAAITPTFKNLTIAASGIERAVRFSGAAGGTLDNVTLTTDAVGIHIKGTGDVEISNSSITTKPNDNTHYTAHLRSAVMHGSSATVTLTDNTIVAQAEISSADKTHKAKGVYIGTGAVGTMVLESGNAITADIALAIDGAETGAGAGPSNKNHLIVQAGNTVTGAWGSPSGYAYKLVTVNGGDYNNLAIADLSTLGKTDSNGNLQISITGGTFPIDVTAYCAEGYTCVPSEDRYVVQVAAGKVARNVEQNKAYASLADALASAANGQTVTLLKDVEEQWYPQSAVPSNLTIDLGGNTLTGRIVGWQQPSMGGLVVKNGTISSGDNAPLWFYGSGAITAKDLTIVSNEGAPNMFASGSSKLTLQNVVCKSTLEGDIVAESGTYYNDPTMFVASGYLARKGTDASDVECWTIEPTPDVKLTLQNGTVTTYRTVSEAVAAAATAGQTATVEAFEGTYEIPATISIPEGLTLKGAGAETTVFKITTTNGDGVKITKPNVTISNATINGAAIASRDFTSLINVEADGVVVDGVVMVGGGSATWSSSILVESLTSDQTFTVKNSTISGSFRGVLRESCNANIVIENCDIDAVYPFNIDGGNGGTVMVTDSALHGWTSYSGVDSVTFTNCEFSKAKSGYDRVVAYVDTTFDGCTFDSDFEIYAQKTGFTFELEDCTKNGVALTWENMPDNFGDANVWNKCTCLVDGERVAFVAQIGDKVYNSLDKALAAAQEGDTVKLLVDESEDAVVTINKDVTIDLNGKTVTLPGFEVTDGNVEFKNGKVVGSTKASSTFQLDGGNVTLTGLEVVSLRHAVRIEGASVVIDGGSYSVPGTTGTSTHAINIGGGSTPLSTLLIKDGTFIGPKGTISDSGAALNVQNNSKVTVEGGLFKGGKNKTVSFKPNVDNLSIAISGGYFDQPVNAANCADDYQPKSETVQIDNVPYYTVETKGAAKDENGVYYATLRDAVTSTTSGDTITLLKDVTENISSFSRGSSRNTKVLKLNGFTVTGQISVDWQGILDVDGGKVEYPSGTAVTLQSSGTMVMASGEVTGKVGISTVGGSKVTISGGKVSGVNNALVLHADVALASVSGGEFINTTGTTVINGWQESYNTSEGLALLREEHRWLFTDNIVAKDENDVVYAMLENALTASTSGSQITLLADVTETVTYGKGKTLRLGGKTITGGLTVTSTGILDMSDGKIVNPNGRAVAVNNGGSVIFSGGEITGSSVGLHTEAGATIKITGGTITGMGTSALSLNNSTEGSISGGNYVSTTENTAFNNNYRKYLDKGYVAQVASSTETATTVKVFLAVASVGGQYFETLAAAIDAAKADVPVATISIVNKVVADEQYATLDFATLGAVWAFAGNATDGYTLVPAVASISGTPTKYFATLAEAFAAAADGDTIKLLKSSAGNGIQVLPGRFATDGLTVDFGGFTYTVDGDLTGSAGTQTQAFQLQKNNKITFTSSAEAKGVIYSAKAKMLINNYCDLTLDKMTLTLDNPDYAYGYTLSDNNGNVVINDTTINANPAGAVAFDVCRGGGSGAGDTTTYPSVHVTVTGNSVINGDVELDAKSGLAAQGFGLTLEGGTMNGEIKFTTNGASALENESEKVVVAKKSTFEQAPPTGYLWSEADANGVQTLAKGAATVTHGETVTTYATLAAAFAAAADGDTVTLLKDVSLTDRLFVNAGATPVLDPKNKRYATTSENKSIELDLNGKNITSSSNIALAGGSLNITGTGKISTTNDGLAPIEVRGTGDLTSKRALIIGSGVTLNSTNSSYGLNVFGSNSDAKNLIDVTVDGTVNGTLFVLGNLKNAENAINIVVNGTVIAPAGEGDNVNVGIALNGNAKVTVNAGATVSGDSGIEVRAGTLTVNGGTITGTATEYGYTANGSGSTTKGAAIAIAQHTTVLPTTVTLNGGTLSGVEQIGVTEVNTGMPEVTVLATQGFTQNSSIPEDYKWVESDTEGMYKLVKKDYVAQISETKYETFAAALDAVKDGETITVLDVAGNESNLVEFDRDSDIAFTITGTAPNYGLPIVTFADKNASGGKITVTIKNATLKTAELDARQNATINVVDSTIKGKGSNDIVKSYFNGAINIGGASKVYTMQLTTTGYITISDNAEVTATWQANVLCNGLLTVAPGATLNTAALQLTGNAYSGRDNTDADRVGKPAALVVDGATLNVGWNAYSSDGADYNYHSSKYGINIGTVDGKSAVLDIKNASTVVLAQNSGNGTYDKKVTFGAGATVNVTGGSTLTVRDRGSNGVTLTNGGRIALDVTSSVVTPGFASTSGSIAIDSTGLTQPVKVIDYTGAGTMALADYGTVTVTSGETYAEANDLWVKRLDVAQIGTTKYASLAEAILAAQDGDTIEILNGTWGADAVGVFDEPGKYTNAQAVRAKSLTIQAAEGAKPKFTADVKLGYEDSKTANATMTVKGLAFENAKLSLVNYVQATVEDCTFTGSGANAALFVGDSCDKNHLTSGDYPADQVTIKDCTFDGTAAGSPAIRVRNGGNVTITGNTVKNSAHNGILLESNTEFDNTAVKTVTITGNTITEWNASNVAEGGRGIRASLGGLADGSTVTVKGNVFRKTTTGLDEPDFAKITGAGGAAVDISGNDWNNMLLSEVKDNGAVYKSDATTTTITSVITTRKEPVAQISETKYEYLAEAIAAAKAGDTVQIIKAGDYTLPNLPNNITIEGKVDDVVFNHTTAGSVASIPNGATFKNVTFNFGNEDYHGFQHAGTITMEGCTLNGKLFSYGDMTFTNCSFNQSNSDYHMWAYAGNLTYTDCTFVNEKTGKFLNVYNEGLPKYTVTVNSCNFINKGSSSKAALNVKDTSGSNKLKYDVFISNSKTEGAFPAASTSENSNGKKLVVYSALLQVDDIVEGNSNINVADYINVAEAPTSMTFDQAGKIIGGTYVVVDDPLIAAGYVKVPNAQDDKLVDVVPGAVITYVVAHGEAPAQKAVPFTDGKYTLTEADLPTLTVPGYVFTGWDKSAGNEITGPTTITALWKAVAQIGETKYDSLQDAVDAAHGMTGDVTVTLIADINENVWIHQKSGLNLTVDGGNKTLKGQLIIDGDGGGSDYLTATDTLTIANFNIVKDDATTLEYTDSLIIFPKTTGVVKSQKFKANHNNHAHNVTIKDCTCDANGDMGIAAVRANSGTDGITMITIQNVTAQNMHSLAQLTATAGLTITGCTVTGTKNGINIVAGSKDGIISGNTLTVQGYTLRLKEASDMAVTLTDNTFSGDEGIISTATKSGKITVNSGSYVGALDSSAGKLVITGGRFSVEVPESYCGKDADGYQLYPIAGLYPDTPATPNGVGLDTVAVAIVTQGDPATTTRYVSLAAAVAAVADNGTATITMLAADTLAEYVAIPANKNIVLDLNGQTVTATNGGLDLYGTLQVVDGTTEKNGKFTAGTWGIWANPGADLLVSSGTVEGGKWAVVAQGAGTKVKVEGGKVYSKDGTAISGIGNSSDSGYTIEVAGGEVVSDTDIAIYHPNGTKLTVSGGKVSGATAIYQKAGTLEIIGGTITGTGAATGYVFNDNGANATGDALVVENCGYPNGEPTVEITGGTFRSTNAKAVGSYAKDSTFPVLTSFISPTGTALFSDDVSDGVPAGYELVPAGEDYDGLYKLASLTGILYVTGQDANGKNRGVMMNVAWLKANGFIAGEVATQAELDRMQVALSAKSTNGLPYWQSYVLGVDPKGTSYPLTIAKGVSSGANYIITGKFAGSTGFNLTPSKNATMTVEFTLVQRGAFDADAKDWAWTKVNGVTTNVSNTAAPQFTVSMDAVANQVLAISVTIMVDDKK